MIDQTDKNLRHFKKAICSDFTPELNVLQCLQLIKETGFDGVMLNYDEANSGVSVDKQVEACHKLGLEIACAHLRARGANEMWGDSDDFFKLIKSDIASCSKNKIEIAVLHMTETGIYPPPNMKGVSRIEALAEFAKEKNVKIAIENKRDSNHIEMVFENVRNDALSFCYDCGHESLYFPKRNVVQTLSKFYPLAIVHLHDNHFKFDEHMIPFDGAINFDEVISKIKSLNYQGYVLLESRDRHSDFYLNISHKEFLEKAYKVASIIASKLTN